MYPSLLLVLLPSRLYWRFEPTYAHLVFNGALAPAQHSVSVLRLLRLSKGNVTVNPLRHPDIHQPIHDDGCVANAAYT
ncbi:hypothetical protein GTH32_15925 [Alteromonas sp. 345S023]|uniref:Uncharacterized protein n=1 Tax=Alteromonas profundi TaxID=2696062 RepID=A0A7X5LNK2_9ALTE|nr:hypothetical protein [Alteromonas profundi]NDV92663.1 hypothetical protein [Alteromonas profundi]